MGHFLTTVAVVIVLFVVAVFCLLVAAFGIWMLREVCAAMKGLR